jgi:hypothetical protein
MAAGGSRAGSGRKRKAEKHATAIARAEKRITDRLPSLIDNLFILADGVTIQETTKEGDVVTYTNPPDRSANEYLINRIMGKPTERKEHRFSDMTDDELLAYLQARAGRGGKERS